MYDRKNILLLNSHCRFLFIPPLYPISLCYIGSHILNEGRHSVDILDLNLYDKPFQALVKILKERKYDLVGLSVRDIPWYPSWYVSPIMPIKKACSIIKYWLPQSKIIAGGPAFSLFAYELMWFVPEIDIGVCGEGEKTFSEIIKSDGNFKSIKGIYYRDGGEIISTGKADFLSPEKIPIPKEIPGLNFFRYSNKNYIGVQTRRGCTSGCIYCPNDFLQGNKFRLRPIPKVIEELRFYKERGINKIYFADTLFNLPYDFSRDLIREIIKANLGIKWGAQFKPVNLDEDFLKSVEASGCELIDCSAEYGSDRVLKKLNTGVSCKDILESADIINKFKGITQSWYFMTNLPGESFETNLQTVKLILKLIKKGVKPQNIFINRLKYCPHTKINNLYPSPKPVDISRPSLLNLSHLFKKDIYMTCMVGLFNIYRVLTRFKRYAY